MMNAFLRCCNPASKPFGLALAISITLLSGLMQAQTLTPVQQAIVNAARNASGASQASHTSITWNGVTKSTWQTDTYGGDGQRMRNAINRFATWRASNGLKSIPNSLVTAMQSDLLPTYTGTDSTNLVNQIIYVYDSTTVRCLCKFATPQTDEQTLAFLGIRAQCREWVDTVVIRAGGTPRAYNSAGIQAVAANFRPGMGLFFPSIPHATLITDLFRSPNGSVQFRIAEANWGTGWRNPSGMVPWLRALQNTRYFDWLGNNTCRLSGTTTTYFCQVVSFQ